MFDLILKTILERRKVEKKVPRTPRFEPGSSGWELCVLSTRPARFDENCSRKFALRTTQIRRPSLKVRAHAIMVLRPSRLVAKNLYHAFVQ